MFYSNNKRFLSNLLIFGDLLTTETLSLFPLCLDCYTTKKQLGKQYLGQVSYPLY